MLGTFLLIIVGLSGDPEHGELFHGWGETLAASAAELGIPEDHVIFLAAAVAGLVLRRIWRRNLRRFRERFTAP